jgi:NhaP-type Na+/H+ or K+/H+ antiporter
MPALIIISLLSVLACYLIARSRSANIPFWVLMGLLLGPLAIPFAFFAKPKTKD